MSEIRGKLWEWLGVCFPGNFKKTGKGNWGEENQIRGVLKRANEAITSLKGPRLCVSERTQLLSLFGNLDVLDEKIKNVKMGFFISGFYIIVYLVFKKKNTYTL